MARFRRSRLPRGKIPLRLGGIREEDVTEEEKTSQAITEIQRIISETLSESFLKKGRKNLELFGLTATETAEMFLKARSALQNYLHVLSHVGSEKFVESFEDLYDEINKLGEIIRKTENLPKHIGESLKFLDKDLKSLLQTFQEEKKRKTIEDFNKSLETLNEVSINMSKKKSILYALFGKKIVKSLDLENVKIEKSIDLNEILGKTMEKIGLETEKYNFDLEDYIKLSDKASKSTKKVFKELNEGIKFFLKQFSMTMSITETFLPELQNLYKEFSINLTNMAEIIDESYNRVNESLINLNKQLRNVNTSSIEIYKASLLNIASNADLIGSIGDYNEAIKESININSFVARIWIKQRENIGNLTDQILSFSTIMDISSESVTKMATDFVRFSKLSSESFKIVTDSFVKLSTLLDDVSESIIENTMNLINLFRLTEKGAKNLTESVTGLSNILVQMGVSSRNVESLISSILSPDIRDVPSIFADVAFYMQRGMGSKAMIDRIRMLGNILEGAGDQIGAVATSLGLTVDQALAFREMASLTNEELEKMINMNKDMEKIRSTLVKNTNALTGFYNTLRSAIADVFSLAKTKSVLTLIFGTTNEKLISEKMKEFTSGFSRFMKILFNLFEKASSIFAPGKGGIIDRFIEFFKNIPEKIDFSTLLSKLGDLIIEIGSDIMSSFLVLIMDVFNNLPTIILKLVTFQFKLIFKIIQKTFQKAGWKRLLLTIVNIILTIFGARLFGGLLKIFSSFFGKLAVKFVSPKFGGALIKAIVQFVEKWLNNIIKFYLNIFKTIKNMFLKLPIIQPLKIIFHALQKLIFNPIKHFFTHIIFDQIIHTFSSIKDFVFDVLSKIWDFLSRIVEKIKNLFFGRTNLVSPTIPEVQKTVVEVKRPSDEKQLATLSSIDSKFDTLNSRVDRLSTSLETLNNQLKMLTIVMKSNRIETPPIG